MVRTSPWPTVLGTAALIALPVLAAAQTGSTGSQSSQPTAQSDKAYPSTAGAATHHLTEAKQVLDSIPQNAVTGPNATKLNQVRRHFVALQKSYSANPSASSASVKTKKGTKSASAGWNTHLMALDRDLSALLGSSGSAGASSTSETPGATGTSGSSASAALDADVRSKLEQFRTHITEFAAAASGTSASGSMSSAGSSSAMPNEPTSTTPTETATTSQSTPPATNPTQTGSATGETQTQTAQPGAPASGAQADASAAREHLTQARQSLADLTALPQAQQLQGDARTQVSQLISQFNQLITTQADWRSSYDQVNSTLTALLGSAGASASSSTPPSSTQGAVGTSGSASASLDPAIRTKLEEFRTHLQAFYTAAGGEASGAASGSTSATSSTGAMSSTGSTSASGSMGTAGSSGTTGTSGSTSPTAAAGDVESHVAAIERILDQAGGSASSSSSSMGTNPTGSTGSATGSTSGSAGSSGAAGSTSGTANRSANVSLTQEQIDQIRMHLQAIRSSAKK